MLSSYFGGKYCDKTNTTLCDDRQWRLEHFNNDTKPLFYHIKNPKLKTHVISIRGTDDMDDMFQDLFLW